MKLEKAGFNQKEMDFTGLKNMTRDEILAIFNTPKGMLGMIEDSNRSNTQGMREIYALNKVDPSERRIINFLNEFFIPLFGDNRFLKLEYISPVPRNREDELKFYELGSQWGFLTVNEIREKEGLPPLDGGDVPLFNQTAKTDENAKEIARKQNYRPPKNNIIANAVEKAFSSNLKKKEFGDDRHEVIWKKVDALATKQEEKFEKMTVKLMEDQQKRALESIKSIKSQHTGLNLKDEAKLYSETSVPLYIEIVEAGAAQAKLIAQSEVIFKLTDDLRDEIKVRADKFFGLEVNKTTIESLDKTLAEGIAAGETQAQLTKRVNSVYLIAKNSRAKTIARTESLNAINASQLEFYDQDDEIEKLEWIATLDSRVRNDHKALHETVINKKTGTFNLAGFKIKRPQDSKLPAGESVNCRCTLAPVLKDN